MHQLTETVKVIQKAALVADGQVLILKRTDDSIPRPSKWDLPGGNSEWPEIQRTQHGLHQDDITREIMEETGISLANSMFTQPIYFDTYFDADTKVYSLIVGWRVALSGTQKVRLSSEHTEFAWVSFPELGLYDFGFAGESNGFIRQILVRSNI
jgi:8-oxo-dGTP pyrophosphatase MutT (NUDIX family)